jgi:predicted RNA-binding protein with PUA-like domain
MNHWLFKSEPETFSIDDLSHRPKQTEPWNGVRNYQVRNMLRDQIQVGDLAFFYHSNCQPPGIVGMMEIVKAGYPDPTAWDIHSEYYDRKSSATAPRWYMVDVRLVKKFKRLISLEELKQQPSLKNMLVTRKGSRLSITPVTAKEWEVIVKMAIDR